MACTSLLLDLSPTAKAPTRCPALQHLSLSALVLPCPALHFVFHGFFCFQVAVLQIIMTWHPLSLHSRALWCNAFAFCDVRLRRAFVCHVLCCNHGHPDSNLLTSPQPNGMQQEWIHALAAMSP
eukprot:1155957-Pelagomonas_calceolata.AAC.6